MGEALLSRQRTVWEFQAFSHEFVVFVSDGREHWLYRHDWEDMGSPARITTATEPGDLLNERER